MDLRTILELADHGPDTFVGIGPHYPWGGLYGGQIVAQALSAATKTVEDEELHVHSLRPRPHCLPFLAIRGLGSPVLSMVEHCSIFVVRRTI